MDESDRYLKKLDKPLLRVAGRISGNELDTDLGQPFAIQNTAELRTKLSDQGKKISSEYAMFKAVGLFIAIAFSLAILAAWGCTVKPGTNILSSLSALISIECIVWLPAYFIIKRNGSFQTAVSKGEIQGYLFQVQAKWIHEYPVDNDTETMYLVQFADVYADAGYSYYGVKRGDIIEVYLVSYEGNQYFGGWYIRSSH